VNTPIQNQTENEEQSFGFSLYSLKKSLRDGLNDLSLPPFFTSIFHSFSKTERGVFVALLLALLLGLLGTTFSIYQNYLVEIPAPGGSLSEGIIGAPRFINPILALSDVDRDLTLLVYSGLLRATTNGELIPDLAETYTISSDGLVYTFTLKEGLVWHDGEPVTSDDVVFTITKVKDSVLKSPRRASWEGVTVLKIDERTVEFTLKQPYSPFLENTTTGILPAHLWQDISSEQFGFSRFNIEPIGSGPYKVSSTQKDSSGIPTYYDFTPFKKFSLGKPYLLKIRTYFYANEEALLEGLEKGEIEAVNALGTQRASELEQKGVRVLRYVLPRVFGVFLNQNQNTVFADYEVRQALNDSLDRDKLIEDVLFGYGQPLYGPLPPGALGFTAPPEDKEDESEGTTTDSFIERARAKLMDAGWAPNEKTGIMERKTKKTTKTLEFSIATSDALELKRMANYIKETWEKLGAQVELKIFNTGDLNPNIIRPRKYDALFFGEIIGRESDPFAFWHSSQRNDPGFNIALYANIATDRLLEEGRVNFEKDERAHIYKKFDAEVREDIPAIFVYSPDFIYILPKNLRGVETGTVAIPSERFLNVYQWFIETNRVLPFFANK